MKETNEMINYKEHEVMVFDMDGTLYLHDGDNGTYKNSSLIKNVISNSIEFVISKENSSLEVASQLINDALKDTIGISRVLAKRYGISRQDYFDIAWNIDPKKVVKNFEKQVDTIQKLKKNNKRMFLLTAAPRVWMENVLNEFGLTNAFERKYNAEMFGKKDEVFEKLSKEFDPKTIVSIGDQFETDLLPAQNLGMSICLIKSPEDFEKLI